MLLEGFNAAEMRKEQMKKIVCFLEGVKLPGKRFYRSLLHNFQMYDGVIY